MPNKSKKRTSDKKDNYKLIADKLLALMSAGTVPWHKTWSSTPYANALTGHCYSGVNPLLADIDVMASGYSTTLFVGFKQAANAGWMIRKGSKATGLCLGGQGVQKETDSDTGETVERFYTFSKWLRVFNLDCIDDSNADLKVDAVVARFKGEPNLGARIEDAEKLIDAQEAEIVFGGNRACYVPSRDSIHLPNYSDFSSPEAYYATAIHELVHRTGHQNRLARNLGGKKRSPEYAFEELVADMGAAFVCGTLGVQSNLEHHASYLDHWMSLIQDDSKAFFKAFKLAKTAADLLLGNAGLLPVEPVDDNAEIAAETA